MITREEQTAWTQFGYKLTEYCQNLSMKQHRPLGRWICSLQRTIVSFFNVWISNYNLWRTLDLDSPWTPINNNELVLFWHASRWREMRITATTSTTWRSECARTTRISETCAVKFKSGGLAFYQAVYLNYKLNITALDWLRTERVKFLFMD